LQQRVVVTQIVLTITVFDSEKKKSQVESSSSEVSDKGEMVKVDGR
jgi:hypothetical protein